MKTNLNNVIEKLKGLTKISIPKSIKDKMSSIRLSQLTICKINALKFVLSLSTNEEVVNNLINQYLINLSTEHLDNYKLFFQAEIDKNKGEHIEI